MDNLNAVNIIEIIRPCMTCTNNIGANLEKQKNLVKIVFFNWY